MLLIKLFKGFLCCYAFAVRPVVNLVIHSVGLAVQLNVRQAVLINFQRKLSKLIN